MVPLAVIAIASEGFRHQALGFSLCAPARMLPSRVAARVGLGAAGGVALLLDDGSVALAPPLF